MDVKNGKWLFEFYIIFFYDMVINFTRGTPHEGFPQNLKVFVPPNLQTQRSTAQCDSIQMQIRSSRHPQVTIVGRGLATRSLYNR